MIDTEHYAYGDLFNEINMQTGGIGTGMVVFPEKDTQKMYPMFTVSARTLYDKIDFVFDVIEEILFTSKLDDEKRLKEIVSEQKSRTQMRLTTAGHSAAATRAMAYFSVRQLRSVIAAAGLTTIACLMTSMQILKRKRESEE